MKKYKLFLVLGGRATAISGSKLWLRNLYDPLIKLGHDVTLLDTDEFAVKHGVKPFSQKAKELLSNELPEFISNNIKKERYDFFLSYLHNGQIYPEVFKEIKRQIFTINYTTNYHQFPLFEEIAKIVDCNIYISKIAKEGFDRVGAKSYYMPLAANPNFYNPSKDKKKNTIIFIGSSYGIRAYYLWRVLQNEINLQIFGPGWEKRKKIRYFIKEILDYNKILITNIDRTLQILDKKLRNKIIEKINKDYQENINPPLSDDAFARELASASIVINFNESRYNHDFLNHNVLLGCNLREFETTMSGSFSLTQYSDELPYYFEEGKEVISFKNEHELVDKLKYYISHETEREKIAKAGYERAINDHTWQRRFTDFFTFFEN